MLTLKLALFWTLSAMIVMASESDDTDQTVEFNPFQQRAIPFQQRGLNPFIARAIYPLGRDNENPYDNSLCGRFMFTCDGIMKCVSLSSVCDGVNNCGNNSDEQDCEDTEQESESSED